MSFRPKIKNKIIAVLFAILPAFAVGFLVFGADVYYDLDTTKIMTNENNEIAGDLTVSGAGNILFSTSGTINQSGAGQVTFAGNVDAANGLDVTTASFTVGGANFSVATTGNISNAGAYTQTGAGANQFDGNVGIGLAPTAYLTLKAGSTGAGAAPLKFTAGTDLTAPEAGAMEWDGSNLTITQTAGPTRKTIAYTTDIHAALTIGAVGSSPNANGMTLTGQLLNLEPANAANPGALTAGVQDIGGAKTFKALMTGELGLTVTGAAVNLNAAGTAVTNIGNSTGALTLASGGTSAWTNTTGDLTISTAGASGTLALTSVGALNLTGATASTWSTGANTLTITSSNFNADSAGNITITAGQGLDTIAAGALNIGNTTATTVNIGNTAATVLKIGADGALARTIDIGTGTGADAINIGTGATGADVITIGGGSGSISLDDNVTIATNKSLTMTSGAGSLTITGYSGTGNAASITSSSTTDLNKAINISQIGATAGTDYGLYAANTGAGTTNVGGYFTATGATNNYGLIVESGNVGIGTTTPSSKLTVSASGDFAFGDYNAVLIDDMESAADTEWIESDGTNTNAATETTYVRKGSGAMKITTVAASSNTDTVTKNITAQDWTSYERIGFWIRASQTGQIISAQFSEDNVTYGDDHNITISEANQWQYEEWNISEVAAADLNAVLYFRFYIDDDTSSPIFYIDQLRVYDFDERTSEMFVDNDGNLVVWGRGGIELGRGAPGSSLSSIKIGSANVEINQPLNVNVAGDTGMAYDLQFLNTGGANITSQGALTISAGNPNKTQNLTLTTQANQMSGDSGVATAGGATSLTDSSKSWTVDEWIGGTVYIISGTGYGQERTVTDSDATSVTVAAWTTNPDTTSSYRLAYLQGGDVIVDVANSSNNIGGFKIAGMDNGGYVFRVGPDGDVEIGGNGAAGSNLAVKQNLSLTGGNITISKLATPTNGVAVCGTVASGGLNDATYYYRVSAINNNGETLALAEFNSGACTGGGGANKVTVTWDAVSGATGYKVYGRAAGAELYMATVSAPDLIYSDTNDIAVPAGALPSANTTGGNLAGILSFSDAANLTLSTDIVTVTQTYHTIDEEGAAVDDLLTINGGTAGDVVVLRGYDTDYLVTAKETGNLKLSGNFAFTDPNDTLTLIFNGTKWLEISRTISGADIAESYYTYDLSTEAGDIVSVSSQKGEEKPGESRNYFIEKTSEEYSSNTLGIVSTNPFATMGGGYGKITDEEENTLAETRSIALAGRVPAKVSLENGKIKTGDFITSSSVEGVAMKATKSGRVIGRALEPFDGNITECGFEIIKMETEDNEDNMKDEKTPKKEKETLRAVDCKKVPSETGKVMTFVQGGWYEGESIAVESDTESEESSGGILNSLASSIKSGLRELGAFIENGILKIKSIFVEDITAQKLCIEGEDGEIICIEKDQLKELLNKNQIIPAPARELTPIPGLTPAPAPTMPEPEDSESSEDSESGETKKDNSPSAETPTSTPAETEPPIATETPIETEPIEDSESKKDSESSEAESEPEDSESSEDSESGGT